MYGVAFSPDGKTPGLRQSGLEVKVWDVVTARKPSLSRASRGVQPRRQAARLPAHGGTVKLWDAATGQEVLTLKGHTKSVNSLSFSPDGRQIATASSTRR